MDNVDKETRSRIMASIKSRGTKMELAVKPTLEALGFEYQPKDITGHPDFAHRELMVAVFLDGCFFHGCPEHYRPPDTNQAFWAEKVARNRRRDREVDGALQLFGWRVLRVWEHELRSLLVAKVLERESSTKKAE